MYITRVKELITSCILLIPCIGCRHWQGQAPIASISDPLVFTSLDLYVAQETLNRRNITITAYPTVIEDMNRYFRQSENQYEKNHLRMDTMLDYSQRITDVLQVYETMTKLAFAYSPLGAAQADLNSSTGLIPSTLFSGSQETRKNLEEAEKAQKLVRETEAKFKKAEADLSIAKQSSIASRASLKTAKKRYDTSQLEVIKLEGQKENEEKVLELLEMKLSNLEEEIQEAKKNNLVQQKINDLEHLIEQSKKTVRDQKIKISEIDVDLSKAKTEETIASKQLENEGKKNKTTEAETTSTEAQNEVNAIKQQLSKAKVEAQKSIDKARTALSKETEHPLAILRPKLINVISDSAFDRLDRAHDFYTAYMLKILRSLNTSQTTNPTTLAEIISLDPKYTSEHNIDKLIENNVQRRLLVTFQVHIDPGTRPNYMVGIRIIVKNAKTKDNKPLTPSSVKIIGLHPTRAYDIDDQLFLERINRVFQGALTASISNTKSQIKAQRDELQKSEIRKNFLSRISKVASYTDAARNEFGWNFYPTNLIVEQKGLTGSVTDFINAKVVTNPYVVNAYLEGGARDCYVFMQVPYNLKEIEFSTEYIIKAVSGGEINAHERRYHIDKKGLRRQIHWLRKNTLSEKLGKFFSVMFRSSHDYHNIVSKCGSKNGYSCFTLSLPEEDPKEALVNIPYIIKLFERLNQKKQ